MERQLNSSLPGVKLIAHIDTIKCACLSVRMLAMRGAGAASLYAADRFGG